MDIETFLSMQEEFDRQHGWSVDSIPADRRLDALESELVGLVGEVGELANLVKRARLDAGRRTSAQEALCEIESDANEELTDIFIYLLRLFQLMGTDVAGQYTSKLALNKVRFKEFECG